LKIDLFTFILTVAIGLTGVLLIASARAEEPAKFVLGWQAKRQLSILLAGLFFMIILAQIDYRLLCRIALPCYFIFLAFLLIVLLLGKDVGGSHRWLVLFGFQFQPSEFAKIFVLLALCDFLSRNLPKVGEGLSIITSLLIILPPILLVILEPDLGTSLCFVPILLGVMIMGNVSIGGIAKVVVVGLAVMPMGWFFLQDYQKERILSFLNPSSDVLGQGYQSYQAKIAVGSGGIAGKGFFAGTQNILGLIPGQHTDFIFTVIAEEKGFIGSVILLGLFTVLFLRAVQIAYRSNDSLARMIIGGALGWLTFQVFINIGVSLGIMPVTGIPLPFMSYGGSSLLSSLVAVGLILSVHNFSPRYGRLG